jgi:hypothetical protein
MIFEKITDEIFIGLCRDISEVKQIALEQITSFKEQGFSVIVLDNKGSKPAISVGNGRDGNVVYRTFLEKYNESNGSSNLHN